MNKMTENAIKAVLITGILAIIFSGIAMAEPTAREKVVQEACYALDGEKDIVCGDKTKIGNWNWLSDYVTQNHETDFLSLKSSYGCFVSGWVLQGENCYISWGNSKLVSFYSSIATYGFSGNVGHGMQCKIFADVIRNIGDNQDKARAFELWDAMLLTVTNNGQVADRISKIRSVKIGDVIIDKSIVTELKNAEGYRIKYVAYPYTVTAITAGDSTAGTVTGIQAKDIDGNPVPISGTELEKYSITKYMRGIQFAQPGDVIFRTRHIANSNDHAAIVVKTTGNDGSVTAVDVVDSNYVTGAGNEVIGYHTIQAAEFNKYYVYTGVSYYDIIWSPNVPIVPPVPSPGAETVLFRYKNTEYYGDPEDGKVYEIRKDSAGKKYAHWIIDVKAFNDRGYDWGKIIDDKFGYNLRLYIAGENIGFKEGTLIKRPDGKIYEIRNGEKHWFPNWNSFAGKGYTLAMTYPVSDQLADMIPNGIAIDYRLVKTANNGDVYVVQGTEKKHVMDPDVMTIWGFDWSKIQTISDVEMNSYSYSGELGHARHGTLIGKASERYSANPVLYFVSADIYGNFVKREIRYTETFAYLGKTANSAYWIPDAEFNSVSLGEQYYWYYWQEPEYAGEGRGGIPSDPNDCASCHIEPMSTPTVTPTPTPTIVPTSTQPPNPPAPTATPTPTPTPIPNLFTLNWHLAGNDGAAEEYQNVAQDILNGKTSITLTYDLHGLCALGNDASAIIFDQKDWRFVPLSNYGQNCYDGEQTVTIPLSDFPNLDTSAALTGSFHTRFWHEGPFAVDIKTVEFKNELPASTPAPTATPTVTPTPIATPTPPSSETIILNWHLAGNDGAAEEYQNVAQDILNGKTSITLTYDLHGLCALGNDASAIIFDQGDWRFISLSNYGQNCYDGEQTVTIPLSDFPNLDTSAALTGSFHTRFWHEGPFTVDISKATWN